ncbi:Double-stranded RNA-binding domain [Cinara cedri]|uniref:Double-stranded RNA-binding domain n=1 Tax=Cinara cedri TaxID=506608 RepID=A0A5E4M435_9HEMI|nr:Double-stranded RNA-binding domain [Cinara cedri]
MLKLNTNQSVEGSQEEKSEVKMPNKRRMKKKQKKRSVTQIHRSIFPKDPLMIFFELYKNVPITLEEETHSNCVIFTASIMIDGQLYTGDHISKNKAKQKACENLFRSMLAKKISEDTSSFDESTVMDSTDNINSAEPMELPEEDFPWSHFASLAMHTLINQWDIQSATKKLNDAASSKGKTCGRKMFPTNPENYNPVQLLHQMVPNVPFFATINISNTPIRFETSCVLNGKTFKGQGRTKKEAKRESAITAIKHVWGFDYHSIKKK